MLDAEVAALEIDVRPFEAEEVERRRSPAMARRQPVDRLQGIVKDLASWLKNAGHPQKAAQVRKQLGRTDKGA